MTAKQSTKNRLPRKPYPSFPLRPHPNGQWCKKIKGKVYFYGVWADPQKALAAYKANRVYQETGTTAKVQDGLTIKRAINLFLHRLETKANAGDRSHRHFQDCERTAKIIVSVLDRNRLVSDLDGNDFFALRQKFEQRLDKKKSSPVTVLGHIRRTVTIFNFSIKEGMVDRVVYGADFRGLSKIQKTKMEAKSGDKFLESETVRSLLKHAHYRLHAMILLGINCGMGNNDISGLEFSDIDLIGGWYESDRDKTGVRRCAKLWPETVASLQNVIERRFKPDEKKHLHRVFITRHRRAYDDQTAITNEFAKLKTKAKLDLPPGCGFYSLRHTCRTIADSSADETAKRWIVGHKRSKIEDRYIHQPPKDRIATVCNAVRTWLFGDDQGLVESSRLG